MFRTIQREGEPWTIWTVETDRGLFGRVYYTRLVCVECYEPEPVPEVSLAALANAAEDPRAFLAAMAGARAATVAGRALVLEAQWLWSLITGIHWHDRPRASLPSDPTEPPF
jgi:hypothetical protein